MNLGFVIIAHESPQLLADLVETLTVDGDAVCIHFDARSSAHDFQVLREKIGEQPGVMYAPRVRCGWGEYSLVEATLNGLKELRKSGRPFDYIYLLSGADLPLKPIATLKSFLLKHKDARTEFIQSHPLNIKKWVVAGLESERFNYRHYFNERRHPKFFNLCWKTQRSLGIKQKIPAGLDISLGSQWWCLTWDTCEKILDLMAAKPELDRFFRTTWIPDESYFQTLVRSVCPAARVADHSLTYYQFNDYGKPVVYFDEHFDFLRRQNFFFGRKIAGTARQLRSKLHAIGRSGKTEAVDPLLVGKLTAEYRLQRETRRPPSALHRSKGRHYDPQVAEISFLPQQLIGVMHLPMLLSGRLAEMPPPPARQDLLIHGDLFGAESADFAGGRRIYAGYESSDTELRDLRPMAFLANVLACGPKYSAFFAAPQQNGPLNIGAMAEWLAAAPNVTWIAIANAQLLEMTLREIDNRYLKFDPSREVSDQEILDCMSMAISGHRNLKALVARTATAGPVIIKGQFGHFDGSAVENKPLSGPVQEVLSYALACEAAASEAALRLPNAARVRGILEQQRPQQSWLAMSETGYDSVVKTTPAKRSGAETAAPVIRIPLKQIVC